MSSFGDLVPVADASAFIFIGPIARAGASTVPGIPVDASTAVVLVEEVIKAPPGLRGFAGREVTVRLLHPLTEGRFLFFADPLAVGGGIAVTERKHLEATADARKEAAAALERGYAAQITRHVEPAFLVALGTVGAVRPLLPPADRRGRVPWASASFDIQRVLKGKGKPRHVTLVGPVPASKRLPRAPALRAGLHAILVLHHPPTEALDLLPDDERRIAAFIADTSDILPPDRLDTVLKTLSAEQ